MSGSTDDVSEEGGEDPSDGFTTSEEYRSPYLSTAWSIGYGFGFPLWVFTSTLTPAVSIGEVGGVLMGILTLAWLATVAYIVGPETIRQAKKLKGGGK
jgi:hypothetical protein